MLKNVRNENPLLYNGQIAPLFSHKEEMIPTGDSEDELLKFDAHSIFAATSAEEYQALRAHHRDMLNLS